MVKADLESDADAARESNRKKRSPVSHLKSEAACQKAQAAEAVQAGEWREAVSALQKERFASLEAASAAVIDQVIARFRGRCDDKEIRAFLELLFDTDPELREQLKRSLSIREK